MSARSSSSLRPSITFTSCEVRKPSKKCTKGTRERSVAAVAIAAKSCASCTSEEQRNAKPVPRAAITSLWSPKMESACVASERAATCITNGVSSPAILNMSGSMSSSPCDAVKVVVSEPAWRAPWTAPAAPPSDCISITVGTSPQRFAHPLRRPLVGELAHRGRGRDRVDGDHLARLVRDERGGFVSIEDETLATHGSSVAEGRGSRIGGRLGAGSVLARRLSGAWIQKVRERAALAPARADLGSAPRRRQVG